MRSVVAFLQTVAATGAWDSGVVFLVLWWESRDALFAFFAAAFWLLALSWILRALFNPMGESRPYVYAIRLLAFTLIIVAIIHKNRQA